MADTSTTHNPQEALADIRALMSRSGRFLSLSGLSGVWAGACALVAAAVAYNTAGAVPLAGVDFYTAYFRQQGTVGDIESYVLMLGLGTIVAAVLGAAYFTRRRATVTGYQLWSSASRSLLSAMLPPLVVGGVLVLAHWHHGSYGFGASLTLVFYGIALLAGSRYTLDELRTLGYCEIALGIFVAFFPGYGLDAWALGFGILHVVYGVVMWQRYERDASIPAA